MKEYRMAVTLVTDNVPESLRKEIWRALRTAVTRAVPVVSMSQSYTYVLQSWVGAYTETIEVKFESEEAVS